MPSTSLRTLISAATSWGIAFWGRNVPPAPAVDQNASVRLREAIYRSDLHLGKLSAQPHLPHHVDVVVGNSPSWIWLPGSAFIRHIRAVVFYRSKKKMRWVATRWIVTAMANAKISWVRSSREVISDTVSRQIEAPSVYPRRQFSVAFLVDASRPCPAIIGYMDAAPKSLPMRGGKFWHAVCSHLISLKGRWLGPCEVYETSRGSINFSIEEAPHS